MRVYVYDRVVLNMLNMPDSRVFDKGGVLVFVSSVS